MDIKGFLNCSDFQNLITALQICNMEINIADDIHIARLKGRLKERQYVLDGFDCTLQSEAESAEWLLSLLNNDVENLKYICARDRFNRGVKDTEDYPAGEEPCEDDKSVTLEVFGYPETSIVEFIIELDMVKNHPKQLADYYKRLRIPGAAKFASSIKRLYKITMRD